MGRGGSLGLALSAVGGAHPVHQGTGPVGEEEDGVVRSLDFIREVVGNYCRTLRNSVQFGKMGNGLFPELMSRLNTIININISSWHEAWYGVEAQ